MAAEGDPSREEVDACSPEHGRRAAAATVCAAALGGIARSDLRNAATRGEAPADALGLD